MVIKSKLSGTACSHHGYRLRSFLGFTNCYRCFIKGYPTVTCPFYDQISGDNATNKKQTIQWMEECQEAFDTLKGLCTSNPIFTFADFTKLFKLHTNASSIGLGAILYLEQDRKDRVSMYASRALSKSESHYPAYKLESLALKWAVTESFQEYLYGKTFASYSNNNPLNWQPPNWMPQDIDRLLSSLNSTQWFITIWENLT